MAFHFQPSADSSDDGEVDITAWQGGSKKPLSAPQAPAPVAPMFAGADDDEEEDDGRRSAFPQAAPRSSTGAGAGAGAGEDEREEDDEPMGLSVDGESETPQALSANRTPSQDPAFSASGFTSINQPVQDAASDSEEIRVSARISHSKSRSQPNPRGRLVPAIPRNKVDVDNYEDFTKDGDVVLRVKKELPSKRDMVRYVVELRDYTVREVRAASFFCRDFDAFCLGLVPKASPLPAPCPNELLGRLHFYFILLHRHASLAAVCICQAAINMASHLPKATATQHQLQLPLSSTHTHSSAHCFIVPIPNAALKLTPHLKVPFEDLLELDNGQQALDIFESGPTPEPTPEPRAQRPRRSGQSKMTTTRPGRGKRQEAGFVSTVDFVSDNEASEDEDGVSRQRGRKRKQAHTQYVEQPESESEDDAEASDSEEGERPRRRRKRNLEPTRRSSRAANQPVYTERLRLDDDDSDDSSLPFLDSDLPGAKRRRTSEKDSLRASRVGDRQSGRATRHQGGMAEVGENDIYRSDSDTVIRPAPKPKVTGAREVFPDLPRNNEFRMRHMQQCESCAQGPNFGKLVFCQGCTLSYHKSCLGRRNGREHLVTKVGEEESVLQCRRCIAFPRTEKKDSTAPDQGICSDCREHGSACRPFRPRKTPAQEQKEREDNDGDDPVYNVDESRINQADNVMFRCVKCWRGFHFDHLPSRSDIMDIDSDVDPEQRFREYSRDWLCKDCLDNPTKVSGIIAWKPIDEDSYDPAFAFELIDEDDKAYLVKWEGMSYFRASWMPGAWVWGVTAPSMRKAFGKRDDSMHPKMRTEDAIPEDYLRADIVLDIKYTSFVDIRTEEIDKARIREVAKALIKYKGLGYEDAVWEAPPSPDDGDRWTDFVTAYNDWVLGRYVKVPSREPLKKRLDKARTQDFAKLEKTTQPENMQGGELMNYQIEGLNWLYFKWFTQKNAILADEMGLGKTIQIIGFLATLVADWNCFPFLVVVPNSTCPNWRREIKRWAPGLRVVAYYGSKQSRDLTYKHELFSDGSKDLKCHIVVTSYDAAADEDCRKFFRSVTWQALVVDEGQRLKNEKSLLYSALGALKAPFKILLTGTPLQNNARELFNLLQFLDDSHDAAQLEQEFADLDQEKISKLHDMIRPFFLRRTKAQVLTFLPPMAQIILPTTMTIVQKKLYRTILAKNPDLMKAIFSAEASLGKGERATLSNILMQLRKCLCHPFVYSNSIEERTHDHALSHRNLVDASSKLKLLELLLPKLKERGHRVLIFSQFLDMLDIVEDFLDGMELRYQRLDGSINALSKQKRIDEFNAPDSSLFAFLLSTRAGGVGINLATADTVIILDPDFNPHQDIQALSRAHRIGQHKKVLCFQLVTRDSAEEKIMQMGRKKLALDHVLIQEMDADDADQNDLVSVLQHGANKIFEDDTTEDIVYDSTSVDRLLDRSNIENTSVGGDKSAESQFSTARVWANDSAGLTDEIGDEGAAQQNAPDPGVWAKILKERERVAAEEAAAKADAYGRGRRARTNIDYGNDKVEGAEGIELTPVKSKRVKSGDESDTDFQDDGDDDGDEDPYGEDGVPGGDEQEKLEEEGAKRDAGRKKTGKSGFSTTASKAIQQPPTPASTPKKTPNKPKAKLAASPKKLEKAVGKQKGKIEDKKAVKPKTAAKVIPAKVTSAKVTKATKPVKADKASAAASPAVKNKPTAGKGVSKKSAASEVDSKDPASSMKDSAPPAGKQSNTAPLEGPGSKAEPIDLLDDSDSDAGEAFTTPPSSPIAQTPTSKATAPADSTLPA